MTTIRNTQLSFVPQTVVSTFAFYAVYQSPYVSPEGLTEVLTDLTTALSQSFPGLVIQITDRDLETFITEFIGNHPIVQNWNLRKNGDDRPFNIVTAFDGATDPDDDFIDLDALRMNIVNSIRTNDIHNT